MNFLDLCGGPEIGTSAADKFIVKEKKPKRSTKMRKQEKKAAKTEGKRIENKRMVEREEHVPDDAMLKTC